MRNYIKIILLHFIVVIVSISLYGLYWNVNGKTIYFSFMVTCISVILYIILGIFIFSSAIKDNNKPLIFLLLTSCLIRILKDEIIPIYYLFNLPFIYTFEWLINLPLIIEEILIIILPAFCIFIGVLLKFVTKKCFT